jgi:hypothetical protein
MTKIAHVVNPVKIDQESEFFKIQKSTLQSIEIARTHSDPNDEIDLWYVQGYLENFNLTNPWNILGSLSRNISSQNSDLASRNLPVFQDIIDIINQKLSNYDIVIYSNMDIAVLPFFYDFISHAYQLDHDAIVINRRRISSQFINEKSITNSFVEIGKSHPGFDCFALSPSIYKKLNFESICLGIPFFEVSMIHQIAVYSRNPYWVLDKHLTFHFGYSVLGFKKDLYYRHNKAEFQNKIQPGLKKQYNLKKFPYANSNYFRKIIGWGLNPSLFTLNFIELQGKSILYKTKFLLDEIRWRILQK